MALYDAEIAQNDAAFGDFLDELDRRGLAASSAVLLTSDHGEEFFDHGGWKHGFTLYEEMLRIPLVLRLPGGVAAGRKIAAPADQIDITPTLLALAGLPLSSELPGRDLRTVLAEPSARVSTCRHASRSPGWRVRREPLGRDLSAGRGRRVRRRRPPSSFGCVRSVSSTIWRAIRGSARACSTPARRPPDRVRWLEGGLAAALARFGAREPAEEAEIDPELDRSLRALGYI